MSRPVAAKEARAASALTVATEASNWACTSKSGQTWKIARWPSTGDARSSTTTWRMNTGLSVASTYWLPGCCWLTLNGNVGLPVVHPVQQLKHPGAGGLQARRLLSAREQQIEVKHNADRILLGPVGQLCQKRYCNDRAIKLTGAEQPAVRILWVRGPEILICHRCPPSNPTSIAGSTILRSTVAVNPNQTSPPHLDGHDCLDPAQRRAAVPGERSRRLRQSQPSADTGVVSQPLVAPRSALTRRSGSPATNLRTAISVPPVVVRLLTSARYERSPGRASPEGAHAGCLSRSPPIGTKVPSTGMPVGPAGRQPAGY